MKNMIYEVNGLNLRLIKTKTCACGIAHDFLPQAVQFNSEDGFYYFNCDCKTTLVSHQKNVVQIKEGRMSRVLELLVNKFWPALTEDERKKLLDQVQQIQDEPVEIQFINQE